MEISPSYIMDLVEGIESVLWQKYSSYKNVMLYIQKWQVASYDNWGNSVYDFDLLYKEDGKTIDLKYTLHSIKDGNKLIRIAIDLGIETPGFIPVIKDFESTLEMNYSMAYKFFQDAYSNTMKDPSLAVGLATSTLESIIKHILEDKFIKSKILYIETDSLDKLIEKILKVFGMFPNSELPEEIKKLGSGLISITKSIGEIRNRKSSFHGKGNNDENKLIDNTIYSYTIINTTTTIGLFLIQFYENHFKRQLNMEEEISIEDIPF